MKKLEDLTKEELEIELEDTEAVIAEAYENLDTEHAEYLEDHAEYLQELIDEKS